MAASLISSVGTWNQRQCAKLFAGFLLWSAAVLVLWSAGRLFEETGRWWAGGFVALQLFGAAQLLLPALRLQPAKRSRFFYLFWALALLLGIWLLHRPFPVPVWQPVLTIVQSAFLLGAATLVGATLGRYLQRLWEIIPVCLVMGMADFASWFGGPTAGFSEEIQTYYLAPEGPVPLVDMLLVKLAFPGPAGMAPVFGVSDWIMAAFFAVVARRYAINDNLLGASGRAGRYLPVSVGALFAAILLAQTSGHFVPALPLMALAVLCWFGVAFLRRHKS